MYIFSTGIVIDLVLGEKDLSERGWFSYRWGVENWLFLSCICAVFVTDHRDSERQPVCATWTQDQPPASDF